MSDGGWLSSTLKFAEDAFEKLDQTAATVKDNTDELGIVPGILQTPSKSPQDTLVMDSLSMDDTEPTSNDLMDFLNSNDADLTASSSLLAKDTSGQASEGGTTGAGDTEGLSSDAGTTARVSQSGHVSEAQSTSSGDAGSSPQLSAAATSGEAMEPATEIAILKGEIGSLQNELRGVLKKNKLLVAKLEKATQALRRAENDAVEIETKGRKQLDRLQKELAASKAQLEDRDSNTTSQVQDMQEHIDEILSDLKEREATITKLRGENTQLLQDQNDSSKNQHDQLMKLSAQVEKLEQDLTQSNQELASVKGAAKEREAALEEQSLSLTAAMATHQRELDAAKADAQHASEDRRVIASDLDKARAELRDYRARAHQLLQEKDRRIAEIAAGGGVTNGDSGVASGVSHEELAQVTAQRDEAQDEVLTLLETIDDLKVQLREADDRARDDEAAHLKHTNELTETLQSLKAQVERAQRVQESHDQEMDGLQAEMSRVKKAGDSAVASRDEEIQRLQKRLTVSATQAELESRLQTITEHLMTKQTQIATLNSEKAALQHECTRLREAEILCQATHRSGGSSLSSLETGLEEGRAGRRGRLGDRDREGFVTPDVAAPTAKRASRFLDTVAIAIGSQLRRSPGFRYGFLLWILVLHLWVFYVVSFFEKEHHLDAPPTAVKIP